MIRYVPTSSAEVCDQLSTALWSLSRPPAVRGSDITTSLFGSRIMSDGSTWLEVITDYDTPVHPDAELDRIADILQPWIDAGQLPAATNTQLDALIESKRGDRLVVWEAFPQLFKDQSRTREELEALNLWPEAGL